MRPKKVILLVMPDDVELSVMAFMLKTNGYRVVSALNGQEAVTVFRETAVDLVLAEFALPQMSGKQLVERLKGISSHVPMILLGDPQAMSSGIQISDQIARLGSVHQLLADALLAKKNCTSQELLVRIKVMSARKRGPRKGSVTFTHPLPV